MERVTSMLHAISVNYYYLIISWSCVAVLHEFLLSFKLPHQSWWVDLNTGLVTLHIMIDRRVQK